MPPVPRRALVVSAAIGEGHNAAGRALEEAIGRAWPGCQVRWLDTLASMGPGMGRAARAFYATQVQRLPWVYEFFSRPRGGTGGCWSPPGAASGPGAGG